MSVCMYVTDVRVVRLFFRCDNIVLFFQTIYRNFRYDIRHCCSTNFIVTGAVSWLTICKSPTSHQLALIGYIGPHSLLRTNFCPPDFCFFSHLSGTFAAQVFDFCCTCMYVSAMFVGVFLCSTWYLGGYVHHFDAFSTPPLPPSFERLWVLTYEVYNIVW